MRAPSRVSRLKICFAVRAIEPRASCISRSLRRVGMCLALNSTAAHPVRFSIRPQTRRQVMQWITPSYAELRFGFEVTMYIANR
jgi:coenzyme PQQ precursor peptide PqqA